MKKHLLVPSLLCLLALPLPALAAIGDQSMDPAANNGTADQGDDNTPKVQQPPSPTPSSKPNQAPAADATTDLKALSPTDALFDAINRGDTAAAQDAIKRGADLSARNSLGLKPVDSSIDLGRNDITFLLLAQRPLFSASPDSDDPPPASAPAKAGKTKPVEPVSAPAPDRGTPRPSVGFLGY
jgi:hypothetical protein